MLTVATQEVIFRLCWRAHWCRHQSRNSAVLTRLSDSAYGFGTCMIARALSDLSCPCGVSRGGFLARDVHGNNTRSSEMTASITLTSCALTLTGLFVVCVLSRMSMAESKIGAYGREQMLLTVKRIGNDALTQAEISRQDTDPIIALLHNSEAICHLRAAKRLSEEASVTKATGLDFVDLLAGLVQDQDSLLRELASRIPD